jgi:hypothetical protein
VEGEGVPRGCSREGNKGVGLNVLSLAFGRETFKPCRKRPHCDDHGISGTSHTVNSKCVGL